ncbi:MAG: hypothetical protein VKL39_20535, partial [Leptolyngbyaceae bacterium]|nr:hypothetical protein [Leptolyngbyaceae bacterium]
MYGFVTGILTHSGGILDLNPAQKAEFTYASELKQARGFNQNSGILQVTRSCVASETASLMIESTDISWSFIQAAIGYAAADST